MKKQKQLLKQDYRPWLLYILAAIPVAFLMRWVVDSKLTILFWTYMGLMGFSGLIAKWHVGTDNKSNWIIVVEHIAMVLAMSLFMWVGVDWLLG